jgi:hypothetical protein
MKINNFSTRYPSVSGVIFDPVYNSKPALTHFRLGRARTSFRKPTLPCLRFPRDDRGTVIRAPNFLCRMTGLTPRVRALAIRALTPNKIKKVGGEGNHTHQVLTRLDVQN